MKSLPTLVLLVLPASFMLAQTSAEKPYFTVTVKNGVPTLSDNRPAAMKPVQPVTTSANPILVAAAPDRNPSPATESPKVEPKQVKDQMYYGELVLLVAPELNNPSSEIRVEFERQHKLAQESKDPVLKQAQFILVLWQRANRAIAERKDKAIASMQAELKNRQNEYIELKSMYAKAVQDSKLLQQENIGFQEAYARAKREQETFILQAKQAQQRAARQANQVIGRQKQKPTVRYYYSPSAYPTSSELADEVVDLQMEMDQMQWDIDDAKSDAEFWGMMGK
ncbi:MAG TPA: hypothetical protein VIU12_01600 [Chryseolinea sp.]